MPQGYGYGNARLRAKRSRFLGRLEYEALLEKSSLDEVIAALPVSCANGEAILSLAEKSWKVTDVADIPVKGRGGAGVGVHPFTKGEDALLAASISVSGYLRGKKAVRAENRAKASVKGSGVDVTPAPAE